MGYKSVLICDIIFEYMQAYAKLQNNASKENGGKKIYFRELQFFNTLNIIQSSILKWKGNINNRKTSKFFHS